MFYSKFENNDSEKSDWNDSEDSDYKERIHKMQMYIEMQRNLE